MFKTNLTFFVKHDTIIAKYPRIFRNFLYKGKCLMKKNELLNKLSNSELENVSGGNKLDDFLDTAFGKAILLLCRKDVADALRDKELTKSLERCKSAKDVQDLFSERGAEVTEDEVLQWYEGGKELGYIKE